MPPVDTTPQGAIRYLTRILAILAQERGGEIHIKRAKMRKLEEESFRLFEDVDDKKDELVLRFDSKHSAIYPVEAECRQQPQSAAVQPRAAAVPPTQRTGSRSPLTDEELSRAEREIARQRTVRQIRREGTQP